MDRFEILDVKIPRPSGYCERCHRPHPLPGTADFDALTKCPRVVGIGHEICGGRYMETKQSEWKKCPGCHATGHEGPSFCAHCAGDGWLLS